MFKIVRGEVPNYLPVQSIILQVGLADLPYRLNLRRADHLPVPRYRLVKYERSFCISAAICWNSLTRTIRNKPSIASFKHLYKTNIFS
jgi:hypothetical protein